MVVVNPLLPHDFRPAPIPIYQVYKYCWHHYTVQMTATEVMGQPAMDFHQHLELRGQQLPWNFQGNTYEVALHYVCLCLFALASKTRLTL